MKTFTAENTRKIRERFKELMKQDIGTMGPEGIQILGLGLLISELGTSNPFDDVEEFHKHYGVEYDGPPRRLPMGLRAFRKNRLEEELKEYILAFESDNLQEQFDGLIDLIYIALGTIHLHGWDFHEGWNRVHSANMKKERSSIKRPGKHGNPLHDDGKPADIIKPLGWQPPNLADLVKIEEVLGE